MPSILYHFELLSADILAHLMLEITYFKS